MLVMSVCRKEKNEGRLRIWLPKGKRWIREALESISAVRELNDGEPSSISSEALRILEKELSWFKKDSYKHPTHLPKTIPTRS